MTGSCSAPAGNQPCYDQSGPKKQGGGDTGRAMSRENVEIVRRIYEEGIFDRDVDRLLDEVATPDIEYVNPPEAVDPGVRHGRAEVAQARGNASTVFEWWRHELHELFDCNESVVAAVSFHARSRTSGVEVVQEEVHTWTMRDGRVVRFEWGRDLQAALKAAGLPK
jgi:ketosteroid isomerase-like protein